MEAGKTGIGIFNI